MKMLLVCLLMLGKIARKVGIVHQASGEEVPLMLKGGRMANNTPKVPVDLG